MSLSRSLALYLLEGKTSVDDVVSLLTKYDLLTLLPSIKQSLQQMSTGVHKENAITIEVPFKPSDAAITRIKEIIGDTKAPHILTINKHILAGFKAKYKGMMYDGSAERIIRQLTS